MTLQEYIKQSKKELDDMEALFIKENKEDQDSWPLEMDNAEWDQQELAFRFGD